MHQVRVYCDVRLGQDLWVLDSQAMANRATTLTQLTAHSTNSAMSQLSESFCHCEEWDFIKVIFHTNANLLHTEVSLDTGALPRRSK